MIPRLSFTSTYNRPIDPQPSGTNAFDLLVAGGGLLFFWLLRGYRYLANSTVETVPLIRRILNPEHLANDYYLNLIEQGYHHRLVFTQMVAQLAGTEERLEVTMLLLFLVSIFLLILAVVKLSGVIWERRWLRVAGVIGFIIYESVLVYSYSPGSVHVMVGELTPNLPAAALSVWAFYFAITDRFRLALSAVLVVCVMHLVEGVLVYGVIAVAAVTIHPDRIRSLVLPAAIAAIGVVCIILANMDLVSIVGQENAPFMQMIRLRAPHHYLPGSWPLVQWMFFGSSLALSVAMARRWSEASVLMGRLTVFGAVISGLFVLYCMIISVLPIAVLIKLQAAKSMLLVYTLWGLYLGAAGAAVLSRLCYSPATGIRWLRMTVFGIAGIALLSGFIYDRYGANPVLVRAGLERQLRAYEAWNYRHGELYAGSDERRLYNWMRKNTVPADVIMHPPKLKLIRVLVPRSSVVQTFLVAFSPALMKIWLERMSALENYCGLNGDQLAAAARRFSASWIVVRKGCAAPAQRPVYRNDGFSVYAAPR